MISAIEKLRRVGWLRREQGLFAVGKVLVRSLATSICHWQVQEIAGRVIGEWARPYPAEVQKAIAAKPCVVVESPQEMASYAAEFSSPFRDNPKSLQPRA